MFDDFAKSFRQADLFGPTCSAEEKSKASLPQLEEAARSSRLSLSAPVTLAKHRGGGAKRRLSHQWSRPSSKCRCR